MYLAKTLTLRSLPEIGRRFGGQDHTTVLHAVRKIEGLVSNKGALAEEIETIKRELQMRKRSGTRGRRGNPGVFEAKRRLSTCFDRAAVFGVSPVRMRCR